MSRKLAGFASALAFVLVIFTSSQASRVCLAPRGYGGSSFRLFEAMLLGVVPLVIGDHDTRPFKRFVDWDSCSLFTHNPRETYGILKAQNKFDLKRMGRRARSIYRRQLTLGRWCPYVLRELETA